MTKLKQKQNSEKVELKQKQNSEKVGRGAQNKEINVVILGVKIKQTRSVK